MARHITPENARRIAYRWHGGQNSSLYAFASSGLVADQLALLSDIRTNTPNPGSEKIDARELNSLYRFARDCLARVPGRYPFAAPWARLQ